MARIRSEAAAGCFRLPPDAGRNHSTRAPVQQSLATIDFVVIGFGGLGKRPAQLAILIGLLDQFDQIVVLHGQPDQVVAGGFEFLAELSSLADFGQRCFDLAGALFEQGQDADPVMQVGHDWVSFGEGRE